MKKYKQIILSLVQTVLITGITVFSVMPFSCKVTPEGVQIVGGDYASPVIESIEVVDENSLQISFSEKVKVTGAVLSPFIEGISDSYSHSKTEELSTALKAASGGYGKIPVTIEAQEDEKTIVFNFTSSTTIGNSYELYALVEDQIGNTLTFSTRFTGYNSRVPQMIMTELYFYNESNKEKSVLRTEYVELLALTDGNLANLCLYGASKGIEKGYNFPPIEVHKGEILLVHLRQKGEGCISEEGEDLNLAASGISPAGIRDLWTSDKDLCYTKSADALILENKASSQILDGVCFANPEALEWKSNVLLAVERLYNYGIIDSMDISDAVRKPKNDSAARSLTRIDAEDIKINLEENDYLEEDYPLESPSSNWGMDVRSEGRI